MPEVTSRLFCRRPCAWSSLSPGVRLRSADPRREPATGGSADGTVLLWANHMAGRIWDCHQSSDRHHKMHVTVRALFCPVSVCFYVSATGTSMEAGGRFFNCRWGDDVHVGREPPAGGIFRDSVYNVVYPYVRLSKVRRARGFGPAFTHLRSGLAPAQQYSRKTRLHKPEGWVFAR